MTSSIERHRVLMVDDNREHMRMSRSSLPAEEFEVMAASTGKEALKVLAKRTFDIIVVDSTLPDMTGLELLKKVREKGYRTPVTFLSDTDDPEMALQASKAGACDLIVKTYRFNEDFRLRLLENIDSCKPCEI